MASAIESVDFAEQRGQLTPELLRQVATLSRNSKEHLLVLLEEELEGGPLLDDLPEQSADDSEAVKRAWRAEIARRIEDIRAGRVELIDAKHSAAEMRNRLREKYGV